MKRIPIKELKEKYMKLLPISNEIEYLRNLVAWYDVRKYTLGQDKTFTQLQRIFLESELGINQDEE